MLPNAAKKTLVSLEIHLMGERFFPPSKQFKSTESNSETAGLTQLRGEKRNKPNLTHLDALHGRLVEPLEVAVQPRRRRPRGRGGSTRQADHRHEQARDPPRGVHGRRAPSHLHRCCSSSLPSSPPLLRRPPPPPATLQHGKALPSYPESPLAGRRAAATTDRIENFETMRGRGGIGSGSKWLVVLGGSSSRLGAERRPLPLANKWAVRSTLAATFAISEPVLLDQNAPL
jgi:hypothetical protein